MFTGIVEEVGTVMSVSPSRLVLGASRVVDDLAVGDYFNPIEGVVRGPFYSGGKAA